MVYSHTYLYLLSSLLQTDYEPWLSNLRYATYNAIHYNATQNCIFRWDPFSNLLKVLYRNSSETLLFRRTLHKRKYHPLARASITYTRKAYTSHCRIKPALGLENMQMEILLQFALLIWVLKWKLSSRTCLGTYEHTKRNYYCDLSCWFKYKSRPSHMSCPNPIDYSAIWLRRSHKDLTLQGQANHHTKTRPKYIQTLVWQEFFHFKSCRKRQFSCQMRLLPFLLLFKTLVSSIEIAKIFFNWIALGFPNRVNLSSRLSIQSQHSPYLLVQANSLLRDYYHADDKEILIKTIIFEESDE